MRIIIESSTASVRSGTSQRSGKPYTIKTQAGLLKGERVMGPVEITLGDEQQPYSVGEYEIDFERSVNISRFGGLEFTRIIHLMPVKANALRAAG